MRVRITHSPHDFQIVLWHFHAHHRWCDTNGMWYLLKASADLQLFIGEEGLTSYGQLDADLPALALDLVRQQRGNARLALRQLHPSDGAISSLGSLKLLCLSAAAPRLHFNLNTCHG